MMDKVIRRVHEKLHFFNNYEIYPNFIELIIPTVETVGNVEECNCQKP